MSMEWPASPVDLAEAARLFARAGKPTSRSSLSRFVAKHKFPYVDGPKGAKLVDARALFDAQVNNFTRAVMAGETGSAPKAYSAAPRAAASSSTPGQAAPGDDDKPDPKFEIAQIRAQTERLDLEERLGATVPVNEVAAAQDDAMGTLRAAFAEARADAISRILQLFGRPESDARLVRDELKRFEREAQDKFAAVMESFITAEGQPTEAGRARIARAHAIAAQMDAATDP